jgi:cytoskeletal protein CcmA (bactofilin family)
MATQSLSSETPAGPPGAASILGSSLVCVGTITADEDLVIRGGFQGGLKLGRRSLRIEPGAAVESDIEAGSVSISGSLTGSVRASGTVSLSAQAKMKGDIAAAKVIIQEGAQFRGGIKIVTG